MQQNSGTGNQQWIVLDWDKVQLGQPLQPDTLWVAETMPGVAVHRDVSDGAFWIYFQPLSGRFWV